MADTKQKALGTLVARAKTCTDCPLYQFATQTVFGAGSAGARLMLVGEQPGNDEDLKGEPFVGPAGKLLNRALEAAGVDRREVYVTNAVKHFKWVPKGKRRLHQKPSAREIAACKQWLEGEIAIVKPEAIVALGATAAQAIMGKQFRVTKERGIVGASPYGGLFMATVHPSSILRAPDEETRRSEMQKFIDDLAVIAKRMKRAEAG